mgnify:CR=1 FL=1
MCNYNKVIKEISDLNLNLKIWCNEPMSKHTSFKIGGNADIFIIINLGFVVQEEQQKNLY